MMHFNSSSLGSNPAFKNTFETICMVADELTPENSTKINHQNRKIEGRSPNVHPHSKMMMVTRRKSSFSKAQRQHFNLNLAHKDLDGTEILIASQSSRMLVQNKISSQQLLKDAQSSNRPSRYESEMEMTYRMLLSQQSKSLAQHQVNMLNAQVSRDSMNQIINGPHPKRNKLTIQSEDQYQEDPNLNHDHLDPQVSHEQLKSHFFRRINGLQQSSQVQSQFNLNIPNRFQFNRQKTAFTNLNQRITMHGLMGSTGYNPHRNVTGGPATASVHMHSSSMIERYQKKIRMLEQQVQNSKIFLNMVIHDLRNPTNSIEYALREVIKTLGSQKTVFQNLNDARMIKGAQLVHEFEGQSDNFNPSAYMKSGFSQPPDHIDASKISNNANLLSPYPQSSSYMNSQIPIGGNTAVKPKLMKETIIKPLQSMEPQVNFQSPFYIRSVMDSSHQINLGNQQNNSPSLNLQNLHQNAYSNQDLNSHIIPQMDLGINKSHVVADVESIKHPKQVPYSSPIRESFNLIKVQNTEGVQDISLKIPNEISEDEEGSSSHPRIVKLENYKQSVLTLHEENNEGGGPPFQENNKVRHRKFIQLTDILIQPPFIQLSQPQHLLNVNNQNNLARDIRLRSAPSSNNHVPRLQQLSSASPPIQQDPQLEFEAFVHNHERIQSVSEGSSENSITSEIDQVEERDLVISMGGAQKRNVSYNLISETPPHLSILGNSGLSQKARMDLAGNIKTELTRQLQVNRDTVGLWFPAYSNIEAKNERKSSNIKVPNLYQGSSPFFRGAGNNEFDANFQSETLQQERYHQKVEEESKRSRSSVDRKNQDSTKLQEEQQHLKYQNNQYSQKIGLQKNSMDRMMTKQSQHAQSLVNNQRIESSMMQSKMSKIANKFSSNLKHSQQQQQIALKSGQITGQDPANILIQKVMTTLSQGGVLLTGEDKASCDSMLKNSLFSSTMLLNLINDLLDLAKMENSQFHLNTALFNLHEVIENVLNTLDFQAQQKNIKMSYVFEDANFGYFMSMMGDHHRYLQILLNFLSNALKFTPKDGSIKVEVRLIDTQSTARDIELSVAHSRRTKKGVLLQQLTKKEHTSTKGGVQQFSQNGGRKNNDDSVLIVSHSNISKEESKEGGLFGPEIIMEDLSQSPIKQRRASQDNMNQFQSTEKFIKFELRIEDSGYGISPENIPKLFMNFGKLEEHASGNKQGTGLGLSVCKSLIELMGGSVKVESEVDKGTTFIMSLHTKCNFQSYSAVRKDIKNLKTRLQKQSSNLFNQYPVKQREQVKSQLNIANNTSIMSSFHKLTPFNKIPLQSLNPSTPSYIFQNSQEFSIDQQKMPYISSIKNNSDLSEIRSHQFNRIAEQQSKQDQSLAALQHHINNSLFMQEELQQFPNIIVTPSSPHSSDYYNKNNNVIQVLQELQEIEEEDLSSSNKNQLQGSDPNDQYMPQWSVLIANDDLFQLDIACKVLKNFKVNGQFQFGEIATAENGLVSVQKQAKHQQLASKGYGGGYDVIVLDLDMPIMNGFEACKKLKMMHGEAMAGEGSNMLQQLVSLNSKVEINTLEHMVDDQIPKRPLIVALSALITDSIVEKIVKAGFDNFIETPITNDKIQERILHQLEVQLMERMQEKQEMLEYNMANQSEDPNLFENHNSYSLLGSQQSKAKIREYSHYQIQSDDSAQTLKLRSKPLSTQKLSSQHQVTPGFGAETLNVKQKSGFSKESKHDDFSSISAGVASHMHQMLHKKKKLLTTEDYEMFKQLNQNSNISDI